jgi:hypothetical protein
MLNTFLTPPHPQPTPQQVSVPAASQDADDGGLKRKQCFAIVRDLKPRFIQQGISENAFWCWALATRDLSFVGSRSEMSTLDWTILSARLATAQQNKQMFSVLCDEIQKQADCRVYRINADLSETKVYHAVFDKSVYERCQRHAEATGCTVRCHAYGACETFEPAVSLLDPLAPPIMTSARGEYKD